MAEMQYSFCKRYALISLFKFDLRKIVDKYSSKNKFKLIDIIIIIYLFIIFCIFENY